MSDAAQTLVAWLSEKLPAAAATLRPPAGEAALARLESCVGLPVPASFAALYRVHDGQTEVRASACVFESYRWLPIDEGLDERDRITEALDGVRKDFPEVEPWHPAWLPFAADALGNVWAVDFASGQVFAWDHDSDERPRLGDSFESFLEDYVASFARGERVIDPRRGAVPKAAVEYVPPSHTPAVDPKMRRLGLVFVGVYALAIALFVIWLERCRR